MLSILSPEARPAVQRLARERSLLAFDFDGTLAPLVPDRGAAQLRPETRSLLRTTSLLYPCAVISGRSRADVSARVRDVPLLAVIGNHGAELGFGPVDAGLPATVRGWLPAVREALVSLPGVELEDKGHGLALHHRRSPDAAAVARILALAASLPGARAIPGHLVVNVVPVAAPTKADALAWLCQREHLEYAAYVGDDRSDEEAFVGDERRVGVRIGPDAESAASYALPDQAHLDDLLRLLVAERARLDGLGDRGARLPELLGAPPQPRGR